MDELQSGSEDLVKNAIKTKDGDQLFKPDEGFKALMGDDEDTVTFVFQHVNPDDDGTLTSVARTTRGLLSFGAVVQGEVSHGHQGNDTTDSIASSAHNKKPFRHWKPSIMVEKTEVVVNEGDQAMLQVQINGYPKPDFRCTFEDVPIKPSKKYKIYHENAEHILMLVIKDVRFKDAGIYTIMAENEIGFASVDIVLQVIRQKYPEIKTRIEDLSVGVDQLLVMSSEVDGIPAPEVQFLKDSKEIIQSDRLKINEKCPLYTLSISDTTLKDSGVYSVVATNALAQVSQFWCVYIYSKPKFLQKLGSDVEVFQGETVILKAKIESEPVATIAWFKNEFPVFPDDRVLIDDEDGFFILKLKNVVIQDAAIYKFRAENAHGFVEDSVRIYVKKAPTILRGPEDATVLEQDMYHIIHTAVFSIDIEAFPRPEVKWFLDGDELPNNISGLARIETDENIKLIVNEPTTDLSGMYLCKISNECGSVRTNANLTVNCSPRIAVHLNDVTIDEQCKLDLSVIVRGYPTPAFKWFRNDQEICADKRAEVRMENYGKHKYRAFCIINEISYAERGNYHVEATNKFGTAKSKCIVDVLTKPTILEANMRDMCVREGDDITYTIRAFSKPPPVASWTWEGELIAADDRNKLITTHEGEEFRLGLRKARMVDAGIYQCTVSNSVGKARHRAVLAVVRRKRDDSV
ncbi:obscurin-like [Cylas formicarius]|uniref:obscurin-like n=1 Tax=Cylas formicarius TaxID=197179 RepID=UPI00295858EF|nr:obscurin-like [Cylas formicarius]